MRSAVAGWDVYRPPGPGRVAGVSMAGFRSAGSVDVRVVPHPALTLVLEFGNGPLVVDRATGRQRLGDTTSWPDRFALTEALVARKAEAGPGVDPEVAWVWGRIVRSRGRDFVAFTAMTPATAVGQPWLAVDGLAWAR